MRDDLHRARGHGRGHGDESDYVGFALAHVLVVRHLGVWPCCCQARYRAQSLKKSLRMTRRRIHQLHEVCDRCSRL